MKVGASHTPSLTPLPLTSPSPTPHRWVPRARHSPTVFCAYCAAGWRQSLPTSSSSTPSSARVKAPAFSRAGALEVRYLAAGGVGEEGILQAAALAPVVEIGESEDVVTRARLHCDGTGLCRAQIWRSGTHARKQCEIWAQFRPNPVRSLEPERGCSTSGTPHPPKRRVRDVVGPSPATARVERCVNVITNSLMVRPNDSSAPATAR